MSESTTAIAIVAIITGIGSAIAMILKYIKHSECSNCCKIDTRTPTILAPPPSPTMMHKKIEENKTDEHIREIEV